MKIKVYHMSGAGNLFSVIDNREYNLSFDDYSKLAPILCQDYLIKKEGLIVINESNDAEFDSWFYNPDGSSDMLCGNGARCAVRFAYEKEFTKLISPVFSMANAKYQSKVFHDEIEVILPPALIKEFDKIVNLEDQEIKYDFIDVNTQHIVINDNSIDFEFSIESIRAYAPKLRYHSDFSPNGTNVNIYRKVNDQLELITYERGVEDITGACGTGAISTAISAVNAGIINFPVKIIPPSKIPLTIDIDSQHNIILKGHAEIQGSRIYNID